MATSGYTQAFSAVTGFWLEGALKFGGGGIAVAADLVTGPPGVRDSPCSLCFVAHPLLNLHLCAEAGGQPVPGVRDAAWHPGP